MSDSAAEGHHTEAKQREWRLAQAATIIETTDDAIVSKTVDGIIVSWNPAAERMFGYAAEEAIGCPISLIVPSERASEEAAILARLTRGESIDHHETTRIRKDGKRVHVCLTITPMRDKAGRIVGATKIARDITAARTAQERIREERERSRIMLTSIGDAVIVTDVRGFVEFLNPPAEALTGWRHSEAVGKPLEAVFNIVNEATRCRVENPAAKAMREGVSVGLANHTLLIARDGTELAVDDSAAPIKDTDGKVIGVILVFRDVSGARAIESVRARLSAIIEGSDDAIVGKDLEGRISSWNHGAERILGYAPHEAVGRSITMLIPPDRLAEEAEILQRIRRGERVEHFDTVRITKDRKKVEVSVTVSPVFDSEGKVIGASKIARDISDRKRTECALAQAHEELRRHADDLERQVEMRTAELRESLQEMEVFASSLSHDLRGPLRGISTYAETLEHDFSNQLPGDARHYLQRITASCRRLSRLIENVLSHARLRTGKVELVRVQLESVLRGILQEYESKATVSIEHPLLPVLAQEEFLNQALSNLVSNAVKFVAPGNWPEVKIWTERIDGSVRVWIEDNGIGIGSADQKKLFTLFTRLGKPGVYEGTGVGLAVVRLAIRRMGGEVGVISHEGGGSRFWLRLRAVEDMQASPNQEHQAAEGIISLHEALRTSAKDSARAG